MSRDSRPDRGRSWVRRGRYLSAATAHNEPLQMGQQLERGERTRTETAGIQTDACWVSWTRCDERANRMVLVGTRRLSSGR